MIICRAPHEGDCTGFPPTPCGNDGIEVNKRHRRVSMLGKPVGQKARLGLGSLSLVNDIKWLARWQTLAYTLIRSLQFFEARY